ncbi:hypothetical protein, partial [Escherichia coli]|uniref:hypothetical protein n=1 Tax=Escherichia coli TaxID=562 RepID=UPI001FCE82A3
LQSSASSLSSGEYLPGSLQGKISSDCCLKKEQMVVSAIASTPHYLQEDDRICIQRRIQHCLKRAKMKSQRATSQEEFSFRLLRSSAIRTEKEMGIYRDRKTAHNHLYRQDDKKSPH